MEDEEEKCFNVKGEAFGATSFIKKVGLCKIRVSPKTLPCCLKLVWFDLN